MTREDTVSLIRSIVSLYPNWKPEDLTDTVNAWNWALEDFPAPVVKAALQIYIRTNKTGFAPSVSQLIDAIHTPQATNQISEGEAWSLVKKAIQDGNYHADERFAELPPLVQKAVGNANMISQWAMCETSEVNTVVMSNFQRNYRTMLSRQELEDRIPPALAEKTILGIGVNDEKRD